MKTSGRYVIAAEDGPLSVSSSSAVPPLRAKFRKMDILEKVYDVTYQNEGLPILADSGLFGSPSFRVSKVSPSLQGVSPTGSPLRKPMLAQKFRVRPFLNGGYIDRYEISPPLPKGMSMDSETGVITGVPELRSKKMYAQEFKISGHNRAGTSACKIFIEVILGSWQLASVRFVASNDAACIKHATGVPNGSLELDVDLGAMTCTMTSSGSKQMQSQTSSPEWSRKNATSSAGTGIPKDGLPIGPSGEFDWNEAVERCAIIVETSGKSMQIKESGGVHGMRAVKGLSMSTLAAHFCMGNGSHGGIRRLLRAIEQRGHQCTQLQEKGLKLCIASEDAISDADAVVYLGKVASPVGHQDSQSLPPATDTRRPHSRQDQAQPSSPESPVTPRRTSSFVRAAIATAADAHGKDWKCAVDSVKNTREALSVGLPESPLRKRLLNKPMSFQVDCTKDGVNESFAAALEGWQKKVREARGKANRRGQTLLDGLGR